MRFSNGWYVIYTKPRHEKSVSVKLMEANIESFLPTVKMLRNWRDRKKYVDLPLFPSYIFVYLNKMQDYYEGLNTEGSLYFLKAGKEIAKVNECVINSIKLITNRDNEIEVTSSNFQVGQQVVIQQGPMTGLAGEIVQLDGVKKVLIRVKLLQRNLLVTIPAESLMATWDTVVTD